MLVAEGRPVGTTAAEGFSVAEGRPVGNIAAEGYSVSMDHSRPVGTTAIQFPGGHQGTGVSCGPPPRVSASYQSQPASGSDHVVGLSLLAGRPWAV